MSIQTMVTAFGWLSIILGVTLILLGVRWVGFNTESRYPFRIKIIDCLYISVFFFFSGILFFIIAYMAI